MSPIIYNPEEDPGSEWNQHRCAAMSRACREYGGQVPPLTRWLCPVCEREWECIIVEDARLRTHLYTMRDLTQRPRPVPWWRRVVGAQQERLPTQ